MISIDPAVAAATISFVTLLTLIGGGFFWLGKLSNRVGHLEHRVDQLADELREEMRELREEMRQQQNELLEEMRELREEMRQQRNELLEEMRRGNQQLLLALANHSHDADGQPIFRMPISPE
jgi:anion-transporting  ArsA/GET3 family ATPase